MNPFLALLDPKGEGFSRFPNDPDTPVMVIAIVTPANVDAADDMDDEWAVMAIIVHPDGRVARSPLRLLQVLVPAADWPNVPAYGEFRAADR